MFLLTQIVFPDAFRDCFSAVSAAGAEILRTSCSASPQSWSAAGSARELSVISTSRSAESLVLLTDSEHLGKFVPHWPVFSFQCILFFSEISSVDRMDFEALSSSAWTFRFCDIELRGSIRRFCDARLVVNFGGPIFAEKVFLPRWTFVCIWKGYHLYDFLPRSTDVKPIQGMTTQVVLQNFF